MTITFRKTGLAGLAVLGTSALVLTGCASAPEDGGDTDGAIDYLPCIVSDFGGFDDNSFNELSLGGIETATEELGADYIAVESNTDADYLRDRVERLERDNSVLAEEMALVRDLERALKRLEARNRQVTEILSGSHETPEEGRGQGFDLYISAISRLRWGRLSTIPILWPVRGEGVRVRGGTLFA